MSDWFKDAVFYEVYVRGFADSNDDGHGDLRGLTEKLDYFVRLGVDCLWILPTYPSPLRDDGYDIADFRGIHPTYGSLEDFNHFIREAHARGLRVIANLVLNHCSSEHPWFVSARSSEGSPFRDYFVWSDTPDKYAGVRIIFSDTEPSNWTFDSSAGKYYFHRFFSHQPDLNFDNPAVRDEMLRIVEFWLARGLDGFRCDAVPYLFEREGTSCESLPETHAFLKEMRNLIDVRFPGRVLVAEANQWPEDLLPYFDGEFHMAFHFPLMPRIFMALRREVRTPIVEIIERTPPIPAACQWALFLRNHDELTLEMVTDADRDYLYAEYAKVPEMRLNAGIRRRLSPLMHGSRRRIEIAHAIILSLPGSPFLYYGDEIGMGDNVRLGDRGGVRTPMQWSGAPNAGFSRADTQLLYSPVCTDNIYHYATVNVAAQEQVESSLLNWIRMILRVRKEARVFGRGSMRIIDAGNEAVLAYIRELDGEAVLVVGNMSRFVQPARLSLSAFAGASPRELIGGAVFPVIESEQLYFLSMGPHSFYWMRLERHR